MENVLPQAVVHFRQFLSEVESGGNYPWRNLLKAFSADPHRCSGCREFSVPCQQKNHTRYRNPLEYMDGVKDNPYHWRALFGSVGLYLGLFTGLFELHQESTGRKFTIPTKLVITSLLIIGFAGSIVVRHVNGFERNRGAFNDTVCRAGTITQSCL